MLVRCEEFDEDEDDEEDEEEMLRVLSKPSRGSCRPRRVPSFLPWLAELRLKMKGENRRRNLHTKW